VRRVLPAVALTALVSLPAAPAAAAAPKDWKPGASAARTYLEGRSGTVAFAVRTEAGFSGHEADQPFQSASVVKAMLLVAYLRRSDVRARPLLPADRNLLTPMVRWSSNKDATVVRNRLGFGALDRLARRAGMPAFVEAPWWGESLITARDQTRFFLAVDRLVPRRHRPYALGLLRRIVPRQRWGFARAVPRGWTLYFKGGWGSGRGLVDHQVALLTRGEERVAVAVLTHGNPDHDYATATLEGVFRRLTRGLARRRE
jgi:beta-lactamase class A